ncbi:MAG TPA: hypothetical protein VHG32_20415 [Thermoanaerobaculia bacterium]|nr:hypothetical protein [Thermoanaerobaculia bacterium]
MKRLHLQVLALAILCTTAAGAQTISYVLVPTISPGTTVTKVEMVRSDLTLNQVEATYVADGESGLTKSATVLKAYIGPSTSRPNPLLDLSPILPSGGMVMLAPVPGLDTVEVSFEVEQAPVRTAWKLPLLQESDFFPAKSTIYVLNLVKATDAASNLQIYNVGQLGATCSVKVLRPKGSVIEQRDGIIVPAVGVTGIADIMSKVPAATAEGINAAVTCDQPFYALGAYPATNRWDSRVEYPVTQLPTGLTAVTLDSRPGTFFRVVKGGSDLHDALNLDPNTHYHTLSIDFDVAVRDPNSFVVFRNVIGMFRFGGRRFGKTLFFGSFENFGKQKYVIDLGTPFIETTLKRNFPLLGGNTYHFSITLDNDQRSLHYVITNRSGGLVTDILGGLYNDFNFFQGNGPIIEMGLGGVADNAYFPPYGWRFQNLNIVATK